MFIWVSKDPTTDEILPYDSINSRFLELTYKTKEYVNLLINSNDLIVSVYFSKNGEHVQKSINGGGERMVRRASDDNKVEFNNTIYDVDLSWGVQFYRAAWIHLDPVTGEYGYYSTENSTLLEQALREKKTTQQITIKLPNFNVDANVGLYNSNNDGIYKQNTNVGLRQVKRIVLKNNDDVQNVDIYITPNNGTIDGGRYRFTSDNNILNKTIEIKYNDELFMNEEALPTHLFAKLNELDLFVKQLGFDNDDLNIIAKQLKTDPYLLAVKCLTECYDNDTSIDDIFKQIINVWYAHGYLIKKNDNDMCVLTNNLIDDYNDLIDKKILINDNDDDYINKRCFTSQYNIKKTITSVIYILSVGGV